MTNKNALAPKGDGGIQDCGTLLDAALDLLAGWCDAVKTGGAGGDDWNGWYKEAAYAPGPLRKLLDAKMALIDAWEKLGGTTKMAALDEAPTDSTGPKLSYSPLKAGDCGSDRASTCVTHHHACACREARVRTLLEDMLLGHSDPDTGGYNACDKILCRWCQEAQAWIHA